MKYKIAVVGFLFFLLGFLLASKAYEIVCECKNPNPPQNEFDQCYNCMSSSKYQNYMIIFQVIMIVSVFVVLYGFFSEFDYAKKVI